jgi:hypothetical protein
MTIAALEAEVLQRSLAGNSREVARAYYRGIVAPLRSAWDLATGADLAYPETVGPRSRVGAWMGRYLSHVIALSCYDPVVLKEWVQITNMLKPNAALFAPRIAARVVRRAIVGGPALPTDKPLHV